MSSIPVPVVTGTILFSLLACACGGIGVYARRVGRFDKDSAQIFCVSVMVGAVCLWLMCVRAPR
jgi:uncharacterized membrane protein YfcA